MILARLFSKKTKLIFDVSNILQSDLLNEHAEFIKKYTQSVNKPINDDVLKSATEAFKESIYTYKGSEMGDFLSHAELCMLKKLQGISNNENGFLHNKRIEIQHYLAQLKKFDISLAIVSANQTTKDVKELAFQLINDIKLNNELKINIFNTKRIPLNLMDRTKYNSAFIKKNEEYILAMMLLHMYDYKLLHDFVKGADN